MKIKPFIVSVTLNEITMILLGINTILWFLVIGENITGEIRWREKIYVS